MLYKDYRFTCELSLEYSLSRRPLMGADGFPRMEAVPRCRTYARQMFDRFLLGGSDPFMYRMQDLWLDLYQAPWAIPQDKEQLLSDLSAKVASGELFIYLETDQLALGPGRYERSGPGAPPEPPEDAPRTSSTNSTDSASMSAAPAAGLPVSDSDGVNAGSVVEGEGIFSDKPVSKYHSASEIELDDNGNFRDKNGDLRSNAGPNAPHFQKWKENGGTVKYDEATDTIIYGKPGMETSSMGRIDVEVAYKPGPPDDKRYPDFSGYSKETVNLTEMTGVPESDITPPDVGDFSKSWEELSKEKGESYTSETYGINRRSRGKRAGTWPDKSPRNYTWHHNGDKTTMQLLDYEIHKTFTHAGGASASR